MLHQFPTIGGCDSNGDNYQDLDSKHDQYQHYPDISPASYVSSREAMKIAYIKNLVVRKSIDLDMLEFRIVVFSVKESFPK